MAHEPNQYKTYAQKMRRANKEAGYAVVALVIIVVAWLVGGIGLAGLDVQVASTPLWIIGGTVGPWLVAVVIAVVFAKRVFANFDLDSDEDAETGEGAGISAASIAEPAEEVGDAR